MARNKQGREMAAGYKTKEDIRLAKTTGAYEVEIDNGIVESSSEGETPAKTSKRCLIRIKKAIRRAARKRQMMSKKGKVSIENPNKHYDVLVLYHQLNYPAIQEAVKENGFKCTMMDNSHLWINNIDKETLDKVKAAFIQCHFRTKQGKEYKVRLAAYGSKSQVVKSTKEKKPSNNTPEVALAAKKARKKNNTIKALGHLGHKTKRAQAGKLRSQKEHNHKPGVFDTRSIVKKLQNRVKKALEASVRAEKDRASQAKSRASKPITKAKSGKPGKQLVMAA